MKLAGGAKQEEGYCLSQTYYQTTKSSEQGVVNSKTLCWFQKKWDEFKDKRFPRTNKYTKIHL